MQADLADAVLERKGRAVAAAAIDLADGTGGAGLVGDQEAAQEAAVAVAEQRLDAKRPTSSSSVRPNMRAAAGFALSITPRSSIVRIPSVVLSRMLASRAC